MKSNDVIGKRVAQVRLATAHEWSRCVPAIEGRQVERSGADSYPGFFVG
jgi:hypothetical protein